MIRTMDYKIKEYLMHLGRNNRNLLNFLTIHRYWKSIMGSTISKICVPSYLSKNILTITVVDSSWAYEINMQKLIIIKKIKEKTSLDIESIRTVVGDIESEETKNIEKEIYLNDEEIEYINLEAKTIENIDNENIKETFKKLISNSIKNEKSRETEKGV